MDYDYNLEPHDLDAEWDMLRTLEMLEENQRILAKIKDHELTKLFRKVEH